MRAPTQWSSLMASFFYAMIPIGLLSGAADALIPPIISRTLGRIPSSHQNIGREIGGVEIYTPFPKVLREQHSSSYIFGVKNLGEEADTYTFTATDDGNFVTGVNPPSFSLFPQATRNFTVTLTVPAHVGNITNVLTVTVLGNSGKSVTATLRSDVRPNRPPVVVAKIENSPYWECRGEPNSGLAILDGTDSYDPEGDKVNYIWTNGTGHIVARAQQDVISGLGLGFHAFTLAATDIFGATATQVADPWDVRDTEPPVAGTDLKPVQDGQKDRYEVKWWCWDECDPDPKIDAQINGIGEQVKSGEVVVLKYKRNVGQTKWVRRPDGTLVIEASVFELVLKCEDLSGNRSVKKSIICFADTCPGHNNGTAPGNSTAGH
ncbi:hypothetical protein BGX38DRAFT_1142454 [Terfezia claveryi]|nr:hypothetical protein BGX38DRAFT_1142454 [Terfezia claveryi]